MVPTKESCELALKSGGFSARHYDASGEALLASAPPGCENMKLTWETSSSASRFAGERYLAVFDGAGHSFDQSIPSEKALMQAVGMFLVAKMQ